MTRARTPEETATPGSTTAGTATDAAGPRRRWAAPAWIAAIVALGAVTHLAAPVPASSASRGVGAVLFPTDPTPVHVVAAVCGLMLLWVIPTALVLAKVDLPGSRVARIYLAFALVLLAQITVLLLWNSIAHPLGVDRPLDPTLVRVLLTSATAVLALWRPSRLPRPSPARLGAWWVTPLGAAAVPVIVAAAGLSLCVIGAVTLNNQGTHTLAMVGLAVCGLAIALLMLVPGSDLRDALALTLISAAVLLGTALRSWYLIGHDIQREYFFFQITRSLEHWDIATYSDPYNACLSITLLPAAMQAVTGLSDFTIFKVLLPLAFAPVAAGVYVIARRVASRPAAVLAAVFFLAFPTYIIDMSYLLRQAIAFLFLTGFVMLLSDDSDERVIAKRTLAIAMGVGVVLSHYSTTYVLALTLVFASLARLLFRLLRSQVGRPRIHEPYPVRGLVLLHPAVVLTVTALAVTWSGAITQTGGHLRGVLGQTLSAVVTGEAAPAASELRRALFAPSVSAQEKLDEYSTERYEETQSSRFAGGYLDVDQAERFPRAADIEPLPPTPVGELITSDATELQPVTDRIRLASGFVLQLLTAIGLLLLLFRPRRLGDFPDDLRWLCVGSAGAVLLFIVGPGLSAEYGFLRSLQQSLFAWAALAAATLFALTRRLPRAGLVLATLVAVSSFLNLTGWSSRALGGYEPQLNLANAGFYDRLYNYNQADVAGMQWALDFARYHKTEVLDSPLVWTDRSNTADFMANLAGPPFSEDDLAFGELYPSTIPVDALIYLPSLVTREGMSSKFVGGDIISYEFPVEILDRSETHLLYNNGYSRVYR